MVKKRGPKPKPRKSLKSKHLHIALTESEKSQITRHARGLGKRTTTWAREILLKLTEE